MTKNENKSNVVLIESMPPFSLFFIGICIFLLLGIHMDLFPQDKV